MGRVWCCKDCASRFVGCHASCETYIQQRRDADKANEEEFKRKEIIYGYTSHVIQMKERCRKHHGNHR